MRSAARSEECDDGNDEVTDGCEPDCHSTHVIQIVAGNSHTCALLYGGHVRCWGDASYGVLGYGNTLTVGNDETPADVGNVDVGGEVTALAAGNGRTCALLDDDTFRCWGIDAYGELGYGYASGMVGDDEVPASLPSVSLGQRVVSLALGEYHTCALLEAGTVRCWGANAVGQLGYGNIADISDPNDAGNVDVGAEVSAIAAGPFHTCVRTASNMVRCWGSGTYGRLGYGNTVYVGDSETPASVGDVSVGGGVSAVTAGGYRTCVLREPGGSVWCWGQGQWGALGYGSTANVGDDETAGAFGNVSVGEAAIAIDINGSTCALLGDGHVRCWGLGQNGRLGYGNTNNIGDDETPESAGNVDVGGKAMAIAVGEGHTCALLDTGRVRCWGAGASGQLGYGNTNDIGDDETPASAGDVQVFTGG